jgi:hypothetical protein
MSRRSTLDESGVTSFVTADTAMGANIEEYCDTICAESYEHPSSRSTKERHCALWNLNWLMPHEVDLLYPLGRRE